MSKFTLDVEDRSLVVKGERRKLSRLQWRVLEALALKPGKLVGHDAIVNALWHDDASGGPLDASNTIKVLVHKIRQGLEGSGLSIENEKKMGYRLLGLTR